MTNFLKPASPSFAFPLTDHILTSLDACSKKALSFSSLGTNYATSAS